MTRARFAVRAERDAARIATWWSQNRPASPDLFVEELADATEELTRLPAIGAPYPMAASTSIRRLFLRRTHYHLYYVHDEDADAVEILATIWSSRRGRDPHLR